MVYILFKVGGVFGATKIQIPLPSYGYGAIRRSRFAFGRTTTAQARANTAKHYKDKIERNRKGHRTTRHRLQLKPRLIFRFFLPNCKFI